MGAGGVNISTRWAYNFFFQFCYPPWTFTKDQDPIKKTIQLISLLHTSKTCVKYHHCFGSTFKRFCEFLISHKFIIHLYSAFSPRTQLLQFLFILTTILWGRLGWERMADPRLPSKLHGKLEPRAPCFNDESHVGLLWEKNSLIICKYFTHHAISNVVLLLLS